MTISTGAKSGGRFSPEERPLDASVDLPGLTRTLLRRRWTILLFTLVFAGLGFLALHMISPRYVATSRIFIDPREQRVMQNEVLQQTFGTDMALVESQVEVITSEAVLKRVVQNTGLATDPEFAPPSTVGQNPSVTAVERLAKATAVTRPENTYVLEIAVTSKDPIKSARLANAVAVAYLAYQADTISGTARGVSSSIRDRLAQLQTELRKSEEDVETFKRENNVSQSGGQLLGDRTLTDLATRQSAAMARVSEAKTRFQIMQNGLKSRGDVSAVVTDTDSAMVALRTQLAEAQRNLAELQQVLGPRHPRVTAAQSQIAQARSSIRAESERLVKAAQDDYKGAVDELNAINKDLDTAKSSSFDTNQSLIKLRELERKAESDKIVYEAFLVRAKETAEQENISTPNARVIGEAAVPVSPSFPPKTPLLIAACLLGMFIGILAAILQDLFAGNFASRSTSLPVDKVETGPTQAGGPIIVGSVYDPALSREAGLEMARSLPVDRNVIFVDVAADAPTDTPGFAELVTGKMPISKLIQVGRKWGVKMLSAGRMDAASDMSRDRVAAALRALTDEYDDVIVNIGALDIGRTVLGDAVAQHARQAVLAVRDGVFGPRERHAMKVMAANGNTAVSVASLDTIGDLNPLARHSA
jgi:succinoglycan biosynthesis transport protein ExoP